MKRHLERVRSTTILAVRRDGEVALGGDGQVTVGQTVMKSNAQKVRTMHGGKLLAGFAGAAADAFTLFEKFEEKLERYPGNLPRAAVELAKDWRSDRVLRRLEALLAVTDREHGFIISGTGDIIEPDDGILALRNRWRRQRTPEQIREEISPNNIILVGPTGVGKTEIARRLARLAGAPFVKVEASKFTEVGYVGRDVESMVRDLVESAINMVRSERESEVHEVAKQKVEERLLDLLLPLPPDIKQSTHTSAAAGGGAHLFVVSPGGSVSTENDASEVRYKRTREKLKALLAEGQLDEREIEIEVTQQSPMMFDMMVPQGAPEGIDNLSEMLQDMLPKRKKKRSVKVSEARRILLAEELEKLINKEDVTADALERVQTMGIIFLDEIDKIAGQRGHASGGQ